MRPSIMLSVYLYAELPFCSMSKCNGLSDERPIFSRSPLFSEIYPLRLKCPKFSLQGNKSESSGDTPAATPSCDLMFLRSSIFS